MTQVSLPDRTQLAGLHGAPQSMAPVAFLSLGSPGPRGGGYPPVITPSLEIKPIRTVNERIPHISLVPCSQNIFIFNNVSLCGFAP